MSMGNHYCSIIRGMKGIIGKLSTTIIIVTYRLRLKIRTLGRYYKLINLVIKFSKTQIT